MKYSWKHRTRSCVSTLDSTYLHSRSHGVGAWGSLAEERQQRQKGKRKGGMMEGEREGGSEVRGVKERWGERGEKSRPGVQGM